MLLSTTLRALMVAALLAGGHTFAQAPAALAQPAKKATMSADDKKAKSKECSAEADKRGLHGKERKTFRSKCKRGES